MPRLIVAIFVSTLLAGCSSVPYAQVQAQRKAAYEAAAGAPVKSFRFTRTLWSWEPLGQEYVAVYTRPDQAWLLNVPGCIDLPLANAIGLTSSVSEVRVGFDQVLTGRANFPCFIRQIRPIDVARLKGEQARQRTINAAPRPAAPTG